MPRVLSISAPCRAIALALAGLASPLVAQAHPQQVDPPATPALPQGTSTATADGGTIHGTVKAGVTPLPGVRITATNTLTGQRYSTTTDVAGIYRMAIPQPGRYVLRSELAAFAPATGEALLNQSTHDAAADLSLTLQSRVAALPEDRGELGTRPPGGTRTGAGRGGGRGLGANAQPGQRSQRRA